MTHYSASGCPISEVLPRDPVPFLSGGDLNFKAHDVGWLIAGIFSLVASWTSIWLILKHLSFFYHPSEQRLIVRILFMPIIYAWCSFFSYYFVHSALYWQLVRDCYEAIIIGSFFYLLLSYLSNTRPTVERPFPRPLRTEAERAAALRAAVKNIHVKKWLWPLGFVKWRPARGGPGEGEAFLWLMRVLVGQYVVIRPLTTLASVVSHALGWYCLASWSPKFVHVWSSGVITISVTVAMYCVLQLYVVLKRELQAYSVVLKFLAVKLVVFFTFWQESALSLLVTIGVIKNRTYWSSEDIVVGIAGLLSCFEMMLFAFMHIRAFSYLPYRALASPVTSLDGNPTLYIDDDKSSLLDEIDPSKPLTFAQWSAWDQRKKQREKELSRLAKPKHSKKKKPNAHSIEDEGEADVFELLKPDGQPILQQTRKWPAFVKCLRLSDLARELGQETKWVVNGGKVEVDQDLLEAYRKDDHEAMIGRARPREDSGEKRLQERGEDLDDELRRIREGNSRQFEGTKIDEDGNRVWENAEDRRRSREGRWDGESTGLLAEGDVIEQRKNWQRDVGDSRMKGVAGSPTTDPSRPPTTARPLSNLSPDPPRLSRPDFAHFVADPPDTIPHMSHDSTIPMPAPYRFESSSFAPSRSIVASPPRIQSSFDPPRIVEPIHEQMPSTGTSSSQDSGNHLPSTTHRPSSYVPPHQAATPSPPPFSRFRIPFLPSLSPLESTIKRCEATYTSYEPSPDRFRRTSPVALPAPASITHGLPAFLAPSHTPSSRSGGLPPGAAAPSTFRP